MRKSLAYQTLEELAQIEGDVGAIVMESLYIRERMLGKENAEFQLLYQISHVASRSLPQEQ